VGLEFELMLKLQRTTFGKEMQMLTTESFLENTQVLKPRRYL
jgi:hypothetical protein